MPDQPADPIHYEMKIPPEKPHTDDRQDSEKPPSEGGSPPSDTAKDTNVGGDDDKPQSDRPPL